MKDQLERELKSVRFGVAATVVFIPCTIGVYLQGPTEVALVGSVGFMLGYIVERVRLHRTICGLLRAGSNR